MFAAMFKALKRIVDFSVAPLLIALIAVLMEGWFSAATWLAIKVADLFLRLVIALITKIPFPPEVRFDPGTFGQLFLDLASVTGLWPAANLWFTLAMIAFITRILTLGVVAK